MKFYFNLIALGFSSIFYSQVGINTTSPKATLDVAVNITDPSKADGFIAPRLKGSELKSKDALYGSDQKGTIVYVTEPLLNTDATPKTVNISETGYYFFDGTIWKSFEDDTLNDVVTRGNYSPRYLSFIGSTAFPSRDGAIGMNEDTYSMFFGNMNPNHTGSYNLSFGVGALQNLTKGDANTAIGMYSLCGLTSGEYNTFLGYSSGFDLLNPNKITTGNVNVGLGNSVLTSITSGYKNVAIGQSALKGLTTGAYNTVIGQTAGGFVTTENRNVMIGAQSGAYMKGENNVFIGTAAGRNNSGTNLETVNNRLVIHGNVSFTPKVDNSTENSSDSSSSWTNGLIIGDFAQRWVRFNGRFQINPTNISTTNPSYTKILVYNPADGEVAAKDLVESTSIPIPPSSGNYVLKSIDGVLQWILSLD